MPPGSRSTIAAATRVASTSGGVWTIQSISRKVLFSLKFPSSKTKRLAAVGEALDRVRDPRREDHRSPTPTSAMKLRPLLIDRSEAGRFRRVRTPTRPRGASEVPDRSGLQVHVDAGHLRCDRQLAHGHLARPTRTSGS